MNDLSAHVRAALWWVVPLVALALVLGLEVDWGAALRLRPPAEAPIVPKPVSAALLPEYAIEGGVAARTETVNRTLFNPTRRPAPQAVAEVAKPVMKKGQFALTGTTVAGDRSLAFLKEVNGGKARTVRQGDSINGLLVAEVKPDRVRLTQADDFEEIVLKVSTNPKPTPQPVVAQAPQPGQPVNPLIPGQPQAQRGGMPPDVAQTLAERRRAARAAEAAAAAASGVPQSSGAAPQQQMTGTPNVPAPGAPQAAGTAAATGQSDPGWGQIYQRYQQRRQQ
jgi:hypothetical protein